MTLHCWKCGELVDIAPGQRVGSRDECSKCGADLHSCRNCQFYDPSKHNQCAETQAEWVRDKEAANYCDYFRPRAAAGVAGAAPAQDDVKKKFNALFRT
ncbi:MAG TPA: hypothetical protein VKV79_03290 [Terriglobia bacterium]|nr:hypothetical protein [Terriglobia bacterium]